MTSQLKPWINKNYIKQQKSLASNTCTKAIEMLLEDDDYIDPTVYITNPNPELVQVLKRIWYRYPHYNRNIFAKNTSAEIILLCLDYYDSMSKCSLPPYDSNAFEVWRDFCRNLSSNQGAPLILLKYLSTPRPPPNGEFSHTDWLNIGRIVKNCTTLGPFVGRPTGVAPGAVGSALGGDQSLVEYIKNKVIDNTLNINDVAGISNDIIVDLIVERADMIDFWGGSICLNSNPKVKDILYKNIDKLNINKCLENGADFMTEIIDKLLINGISVSWEFKPKCYRFEEYQRAYYNKTGWNKCTNVKLLEENLDKIRDLGGLTWDIIARDPDIFTTNESESLLDTNYVFEKLDKKIFEFSNRGGMLNKNE